jgi:hypothetical protein
MIHVIKPMEIKISNIIKKETAVVDGFGGYEDGVEGHDRPQGAGLIQGLTKFTNEATWERDDEEIPSDLELIAADVVRVVQRWEDGRPAETRILEPGEKFPDIEALNEAVPRSEWAEGPDGKPRGPWQAQHILYLVDPETMDKYTYLTGTTGGGIAIRELVNKVTWIRRLKGDNVYAVVTLGDTFMKTRFGGRQRPHFKIVRWTRLGGEGDAVEALPPPPATPTPAQQTTADVPLVPEPSLAEEMNDSIDDLPGLGTAESEKPAKASVEAPPNRQRVSTLEAG